MAVDREFECIESVPECDSDPETRNWHSAEARRNSSRQSLVWRRRDENLNIAQRFFDFLRDVSRETICFGSISDNPPSKNGHKTYHFVRDVSEKVKKIAPERTKSDDASFYIFFARFGIQRRHPRHPPHHRKWSIGPHPGPG